MYHKRQDDMEDFTTNTTERSEYIEGLDTNTDYMFRIRAYTSEGPGTWSNKLPYRTTGHRKSCTYHYTLMLG